MKSKKLTVLMQGIKHIHQYIQNQTPQNLPNTISVNFESSENTTTATAFQFKKLQSLFPSIEIKQVIQEFSQYLSLPSEILGKRSSKIILSKSSKYCLKIVQQPDIQQIIKLFDTLCPRFANYEKNCLVPIYFIFIINYVISGVKMTDRYILMPNIRAEFDSQVRTFDIKGHLDARIINHQDFIDFKFGKDENFVQSQELKIIRSSLSKQQLKQIIDQIEEVVQYLTSFDIIDYSLLFSIQKVNANKQQNQQDKPNQKYQPFQHFDLGNGLVLKWVIIDYFQLFNEKKKLQNKFKSLFRKTVSSVEPKVYSQRLIKFLNKYLVE